MMNQLHEKLRKQFESGKKYLLSLKKTNLRDEFWGRILQHPDFSKQTKHEVQSHVAWIPDFVAGVFFEDSFIEELAFSFALNDKVLIPDSSHRQRAESWLQKLKLNHLKYRNPRTVSRGEATFLWMLLQLAKQPEFLVISSVPTCLSIERKQLFLKVVDNLQEWGNEQTTVLLSFEDENEKQLILGSVKKEEWETIQVDLNDAFEF